ncbi:MAG TPA: CU044_5270 family protein [Solirubrobacteraceae bacterium]|jgi:RNA polymerase sigma-70 factor (ECF subfamily)|nr:CU044_5270 family protein [Solirubrobacteraceae bacterium]
MLEELERELERVRAYGADLPEPDDATVAAARLELMAAIGREPLVASARGRGRSTASRSRERLRKLQRRRRFMLAGGLATAGVGVAGVLGFTTAATPVSALAAQMNQLARVAASQDWTGIPGPGQYLYTESDAEYDIDTYVDSKACVISAIHHRQIWIATDGSGALNDIASGFQFTSSADQAECAAMGITDPGSPSVVGTNSGGSRFPADGLSFPTSDWRSLSTDPATLLTQIHERDGGPESPAELFTNVADFMRESDVPPVIRAALYKATALIPGVKLRGRETTHDGRSGVGVAFYADGQPTHAMIFDQTTGQMLGEIYYDAGGRVVSWADYLQQKIVNSLPDYPADVGVATPDSSARGTSTGKSTDTTTGVSTTTTGVSATTAAASTPPQTASSTTTSG